MSEVDHTESSRLDYAGFQQYVLQIRPAIALGAGRAFFMA